MTNAKDTADRSTEESRTLAARKRRGEKLVVLMVLGIVLLNFPILSLFNTTRLLFGIPLLYMYLFSVWLLLIVAMVVIFRDRPDRPSPGRTEPKG